MSNLVGSDFCGQWSLFLGGNRAYSTAKATAKAAKPHLNPLSRTFPKVTGCAKPPMYLHASLLQIGWG